MIKPGDLVEIQSTYDVFNVNGNHIECSTPGSTPGSRLVLIIGPVLLMGDPVMDYWYGIPCITSRGMIGYLNTAFVEYYTVVT